MAQVTIDFNLPEGVTITGYHRNGDGHVFEVAWPVPARHRCARCRRDEPARVESGGSVGEGILAGGGLLVGCHY